MRRVMGRAGPAPEPVARRGTMCHMSESTTRRHRSFRFSETTLRRLDERAHEIRETRTGLAERYVDEGLRMDEHPGIGFADGPAGRRAILLGTGLDVWEAVDTVKQNAGSVDAAARYLERPAAPLRIAIRYYAAFPDEIDEFLGRRDAIADREQAASERERAVLG
jgi:predicted component of type VI protein secretion system